MTVARPRTVEDAVAALADLPEAQLLAGGTDFMVEVSFGHRRPTDVVALRRVAALREHDLGGGDAPDGDSKAVVRLGAGVTYAQIEADLADAAPALAQAARTVGSPQIRNAGTIGGNVATASPAGDTLPVLLAYGAEVVLRSSAGERLIPLATFLTGPKRTAIDAGELITEVRWRRTTGPQAFAKVGPRNAMAISVVCLALVLDVSTRGVRVGLGSVGPTPLRAPEAEASVAAAIDWDRLTAPEDAAEDFAQQVAAAVSPIDDHRGTAAYRRHATAVLARRTLQRTLAA